MENTLLKEKEWYRIAFLVMTLLAIAGFLMARSENRRRWQVQERMMFYKEKCESNELRFEKFDGEGI